jgi:hypothetical protein
MSGRGALAHGLRLQGSRVASFLMYHSGACGGREQKCNALVNGFSKNLRITRLLWRSITSHIISSRFMAHCEQLQRWPLALLTSCGKSPTSLLFGKNTKSGGRKSGVATSGTVLKSHPKIAPTSNSGCHCVSICLSNWHVTGWLGHHPVNCFSAWKDTCLAIRAHYSGDDEYRSSRDNRKVY